MLWFVILTFQEGKILFCNIVRTLCEFFMKRNFAWTRFGARLHNEWFQTSAGKFLSDCKLYNYWYVCFWNFYHHIAVVIMFSFITLPKIKWMKSLFDKQPSSQFLIEVSSIIVIRLLFKSLGEFWSSLTLPFNSQIKFVILHTVNHTILIMLVQWI